MTEATHPRVLLAVTFYNGRDFARRTLESIARLERSGFELDVLILDDASPEPGFSAYLAEMAAELGIVYSRSPRNLGIPRNVNIGLATAQKLGYDYVVISNSDVIYARNSLQVFVDTIVASPRAASATAWSTNVEPYSLPNGVELYEDSQEVADQIGLALVSRFSVEALPIPAGISFAMIIPVGVLGDVGLMDPVFGRGYGEESDWSARATSAGYDHLLALGSYVYHAGRGSTLAAGVVEGGDIADWGNQRIVEHRSPMFRWAVDGFLRSGSLEERQLEAVQAIIGHVGRVQGYAVINPHRDWVDVDPALVTVAIRSETYEVCTAHWQGFTADIDTDTTDVLGAIRDFFGGAESQYSNMHAATWEGAERYGYPVGL